MAVRVLIVDDHPGFRASARLLLEAQGLEVVGEAGDGGEALRLAGELAPDVALVDVGLPDMDGFDVARALTGRDGALCVVMVSSRDAADFEGLVAECGACGFVGKSDLSGGAIEDFRARWVR